MQFVLNTPAANFSCARQELALTIAEIASMLEVSLNTVREWELGNQFVPDQVWAKLAQFNKGDLQSGQRAA
jgi:DNA-binding transcriptional regulator YiaG